MNTRNPNQLYTVLDYDETKGAVDAFDQKWSARTRRWPMRLFFVTIDAVCLNAFVVWALRNTK